MNPWVQRAVSVRMYVVTSAFKPFNRLISTSLDDVEGMPYSGFPIPKYEYDPLRDGRIASGWYDRMKSTMNNGIAHRLLGCVWKPGVLEKEGVFEERWRGGRRYSQVSGLRCFIDSENSSFVDDEKNS